MKRILVLLAIAFYGSTALGSPTQSDLAAYLNDVTRLETMMDAAQEKGDIAQLKTPEVMSLVKSISDESKIFKKGAYTTSELENLTNICSLASRTSLSFMLFGLSSLPDQARDQAQVVTLLEKNIFAFQDELMELQPFVLHCLAEEVHPLSEFMLSLTPAEFTDVRRQGLSQMRAGFVGVYIGAFQIATDSTYSDELRLSFLTALADSSDALSSAVELPTRKQLHEGAKTAAANAIEPYKPYLDRIAGSLSSETCEGLCAIH